MHIQAEAHLIKCSPIVVPLYVNGQVVEFELDTGSPWTIVGQDTYRALKNMPPIEQEKVSLKTYNGTAVEILGSVHSKVQLTEGGKSHDLTILVAKQGVNLCGRDCCSQLDFAVKEAVEEAVAKDSQTNAMQVEAEMPLSLPVILDQEADVFATTQGIGKLKGYQAKVHPIDDPKPKFFKASSLAYATRTKVDSELDRLLDQGIIEPVRYADYACPLVVAKKPDGQIRICGNYKLTANKVLKLEQYPIPTLDDLLQSLQGGQKFSKLDLSHAYHQVELEPAARPYTTVNTHRGLFQYCRLPFGIASAPAIFQRTMESLVGDIPMCKAYLDDIIVTGRSDEEHLSNLHKVLQRLRENGMKLKREKCVFLQESVTYLGHVLSAEGIKPVRDKVKAIKEAPEPQNQSELQAFLGLLGYYRKFLPNLSQQLAPLNELLKSECKSAKGSESKFVWTANHRDAFNKAKALLSSDTVLVHYDANLPVLLQTDASAYGLGAVISHQMPDGQEKPIAFASRTLSVSEKNYAQFEKEALSIIFGITKFHKYLYGRPFTIITDHKPLVQLFGDKPHNPMASARMTRWQILLSGYQYDIRYKPGREHQNADALSRLPLQECWPASASVPINLLSEVETSPVEASEIKRFTAKDTLLAKVKEYLLSGWPARHNLDSSLHTFYDKREELSLEDGIVLWGSRVVLPEKGMLRQRIVEELHATHPGIVKMKALARSYIWWPRIDDQLEEKVRSCQTCQDAQSSPPASVMHPWEFPDNPWERVHLDYASVEGKDVLIVVDAYSKWIDAKVVESASAAATIRVVRQMFACFGLPETIVTDNGSQFVSEEFFDFLSQNGVRLVQTAPKHPSSNGLAERAVQTVKSGVKKVSGGTLDERLQKLLLRYRITPQGTTGQAPSELMMKRKLRTRLDLVRPSLNKKVKRAQQVSQSYKGGKVREIQINDKVQVKNFSSGPTWLYGTVRSEICPTMYEVLLNDGRTVRRHIDHMRICSGVNVEPNENELPVVIRPASSVEQEPEHPVVLEPEPMEAQIVGPRRSQRTSVMPSKFDNFVVYKANN